MKHLNKNIIKIAVFFFLIFSVQSAYAQQWVWDEIDKESESLSFHEFIVGLIGIAIVVLVVKIIKSVFFKKKDTNNTNKHVDDDDFLGTKTFDTEDVMNDEIDIEEENHTHEAEITLNDIEEKSDDLLINIVHPHSVPDINVFKNICDNITTPQAIDLGLSIKWSSHNLNAEKSSDSGEYYMWGCVENWDRSSWSQFRLWDKEYKEILSIIGNDDGVINGNRSFDAASYYLGNGWRIPTKEECLELINKCTFSPAEHNEIKGCAVQGVNGNAIFIPFAGTRINGWTFPSTNFGIVAYLHTGTLCLLEGIEKPFTYEIEITYDSTSGICTPKLLPHELSGGVPIRPVIA